MSRPRGRHEPRDTARGGPGAARRLRGGPELPPAGHRPRRRGTRRPARLGAAPKLLRFARPHGQLGPGGGGAVGRGTDAPRGRLRRPPLAPHPERHRPRDAGAHRGAREPRPPDRAGPHPRVPRAARREPGRSVPAALRERLGQHQPGRHRRLRAGAVRGFPRHRRSGVGARLLGAHSPRGASVARRRRSPRGRLSRHPALAGERRDHRLPEPHRAPAGGGDRRAHAGIAPKHPRPGA